MVTMEVYKSPAKGCSQSTIFKHYQPCHHKPIQQSTPKQQIATRRPRLSNRHSRITLATKPSPKVLDFKQKRQISDRTVFVQPLAQCSSSQRSWSAASPTSPEPSPKASSLIPRANGRANNLKPSNSHSSNNNHQACTTTIPGTCTRAGVMGLVGTSAMAKRTEVSLS